MLTQYLQGTGDTDWDLKVWCEIMSDGSLGFTLTSLDLLKNNLPWLELLKVITLSEISLAHAV